MFLFVAAPRDVVVLPDEEEEEVAEEEDVPEEEDEVEDDKSSSDFELFRGDYRGRKFLTKLGAGVKMRLALILQSTIVQLTQNLLSFGRKNQ